MAKYIFNRFIISLITIWLVVTTIFFLVRFLPGGPFDGEINLPPQIMRNLNAKFGLDKPIMEQYAIYMKNLITKGDMGPSMKYEFRTVNEIIAYSFPPSAKIGGLVVIVALIAGVNLGIISALNNGKFADRFTMVLATIGVTIPSFVLSTVLVIVVGEKLRWLPPTGYGTPRQLIMPVIALSGYSTAFIARLTRSRFLDVSQQDYIRTAKANGLGKASVIFKHTMRNCLIPVVTYLGSLVAGVLTGSFVVETIFAIPGLGREFVQSIGNRDYSMVLGVAIFYSSLIILCNFIVDILYLFIDPRIKLQ